MTRSTWSFWSSDKLKVFCSNLYFFLAFCKFIFLLSTSLSFWRSDTFRAWHFMCWITNGDRKSKRLSRHIIEKKFTQLKLRGLYRLIEKKICFKERNSSFSHYYLINGMLVSLCILYSWNHSGLDWQRIVMVTQTKERLNIEFIANLIWILVNWGRILPSFK